MTDGRTDEQTQNHGTLHASIASRGKKNKEDKIKNPICSEVTVPVTVFPGGKKRVCWMGRICEGFLCAVAHSRF